MFSLDAYINSERQVLEKTDKIVYTVFLRTFVSGAPLCDSFTLLSFNSMKWIHFQMKKQQFSNLCKFTWLPKGEGEISTQAV